MVRAQVPHALGLGRASGGSDHLGAQGPGPLDQDLSHASGGGVDEHRLPGPQGPTAQQQKFGGHALQQGGGRRALIHALGDPHRASRIYEVEVGIGANGPRGEGHPVPWGEPLNALPRGEDLASTLHTQSGGQLQGIEARPVVGVDIVDADGHLPDQDLAGARPGVGELDEVEDIGTAGGGEAHGSGLSEMAVEEGQGACPGEAVGDIAKDGVDTEDRRDGLPRHLGPPAPVRKVVLRSPQAALS